MIVVVVAEADSSSNKTVVGRKRQWKVTGKELRGEKQST
jgi:hypothetical protein